jgi:hypothetical protein
LTDVNDGIDRSPESPNAFDTPQTVWTTAATLLSGITVRSSTEFLDPTGHPMQTISGTFNDRQTAQRAVDQLLARGFTNVSIHLQTPASSDRPDADTPTDRGMMASVGNFFSNLFGESEEKEHAGNDAETGRGGSSVVAVDTSDDSEVQMAESIMGQLGSINVDNRAE